MADFDTYRVSDRNIEPDFNRSAKGSGNQEDAQKNAPRRRKRKPTDAPFSLRLTWEERDRLKAAAGRQPLGAYIRSVLLGDGAAPRKARSTTPVADHQALGKLLGELGKSRLSSNLNQLARAANSGSLPVTPDTEAALREACRNIERMRRELVAALGLKAGPE